MAHRHKLYPLCLLTLSAILLAGCRRADDADGRVTLRFSYWGMVQDSRVWEEVARRFNARQNRIRVKLEHITGMNYHAKVMAMTVGNCAPDVLLADDEQFRQLADAGLYIDLTPYLQRETRRKLAEFYPAMVDNFRFEGKPLGVPCVGNCLLIFYNRDARRAAGLSADPNPNWTWEEFNRDCVALTKDKDKDGRNDQFALFRLSWFYCVQWVWGAGGTEMDPGMTHYLFDTPEAKRGFQFHYDQLHKYKVSPTTGDFPNMTVEPLFLTGKIAMNITGPWWIVQARQAKTFDWDIAHMPIGPKKRATRVTAEALSISPQCKHKDEAWEWIQFVVSDEAQEIISKAGRGVPSVRSVAMRLIANPTTPQHEERFLEALDQYAQPSALHKRWMATEAVFNREWDRVYTGKITVEDWVRLTLPEANAIVRGEDL
jgi:multiple sugar transport system substrate-binding protein